MSMNVAQKLISAHLAEGEMSPGAAIALHIEQTLTQDATGALAMRLFETMDVGRVRTETSVQYVDHNLLQADALNADDSLFLKSACRRFGLWYSRPGNGISHVVHMQRFGKPGKSLLGSDYHTPAAASLGMLAIGAGALNLALAMAGEPFPMTMPKIWGIRLVGRLPEWVSAKDLILEILRRHGVAGGVGKIIEYYGPGLAGLSAMDRHVIANMGAELGATTTVFPSDMEVHRFLGSERRGQDWLELQADDGATYDEDEEIDLSVLEPLIAKPSSPGNVVPVREVAGEPIYQAYIGSSANPGWRDFAIVAEILRGKATPLHVSLDINPTSRQTLEMLANDGRLGSLVASGARVHQAGCNGCIGMGQAPAAGRNSLRTIPCNSPGRSGTKEDRVWLCSPETAAASALTGRITDPRTLSVPYPSLKRPALPHVNMAMFSAPLSEGEARHVAFLDASHAIQLPKFDALPDVLEMPVALKMGDHVSTDDIVVAGTCVFPYGSNEQKTDDFCFARVKPDYVERMRAVRGAAGLAVVAGENHGQGACREHATIALRERGLHVVLAKSFARIHRQNLINYGVLPLTFAKAEDYNRIREGDVLFARDLRNTLEKGNDVPLDVVGKGTLSTRHGLTVRQVEIVLAGGLINCRRTIPARNTQTSTQADHIR